MNHQPGAHRGDRARRDGLRPLGLLAALYTIASPQLWAQNGNTQTNTAQAVLRITVRVAPVVMLAPPPKSKSEAAAGIHYSLPHTPPAMTVTEETRPLPTTGALALPAAAGGEGARLKTLTVVAH